MKPYFPHPCNSNLNVSVILDPCHMLKLIRNTLDSYKILINSKGIQTIIIYIIHIIYTDNSRKEDRMEIL